MIYKSYKKILALGGGPLEDDEYELWQFHAHWGKDDSCGSEHTLDGKSFPCEVNIEKSTRVHFELRVFSVL